MINTITRDPIQEHIRLMFAGLAAGLLVFAAMLAWRGYDEAAHNRALYGYHLLSANHAEALDAAYANVRHLDGIGDISPVNITERDAFISASVLEFKNIIKHGDALLALDRQFANPVTAGSIHRLRASLMDLHDIEAKFGDDRLGFALALANQELDIDIVSAQLIRLHQEEFAQKLEEQSRRKSITWAVFTILLGLFFGVAVLLWRRSQRLIAAAKGHEQQAIEALQESTQRLNEAQRLAMVGSWELDLVSNQLHWSDEIFRMFEVDQSRFGASYEAFLNAIHPDDRDAVNVAYTNSLSTRQPYEIVHRLKMADGRIKFVRETCESLFDADGKPLRSVGTVQDITELHEAEMELRQHRERLEELVQMRTAELAEREHQLRVAQHIARLGYWSVDFNTGELVWSDEVFDIFGRNREDFAPSYDNFFACVLPDDREAVLASEQEATKTGRHSVDHRILMPDGSVRWVHEEAQIEFDETGKPWKLNGAVQDITERKQAEAALVEARNEAERANKAKSEFLARMSHELRTPMNAIIGFSQVLEVEPINSEQLGFVHEIHHAGDHLLELINELLDLSRIEAGKFVAELRPVNVQSMISDAVQITQMLVSAKRISLHIQCEGDFTVLADSTRLKQILVNLLSNAAKYNREGGHIQLACHGCDGGVLRLSVADTGPGIPAEKLEKLFKPFERLGAEFSAVEGAGIGLALSKQLAEHMGGVLGVDSTPGVGSTFWLDLPLAPEAEIGEMLAQPDNASIVDTRQLKVLYVEDNAANLRLVEAVFRRHPRLTLLSAVDGKIGLELARGYRPAVILLDIHLPGMDGYAVLKALQADPATRDIPVVALSADAMAIDIEKGLKAGFVEYLTKPLNVGKMLQTFDRCLQGSEEANA